jgi:hypothetical protein
VAYTDPQILREAEIEERVDDYGRDDDDGAEAYGDEQEDAP